MYQTPLPHEVMRGIIVRFDNYQLMSEHARAGLVPQRTRGNASKLEAKPKVELSHQEEDPLLSQLDVEIECPRCHDIMELFSKFDDLSYFCGGCSLELNVT